MMFDVIDFVQETGPMRQHDASDVLTKNRQKLADVAAYTHLHDNWDEAGALSPKHDTITVALDIALLLIAEGQTIYHTSPGPVGEIMLNLRNGGKSVELLIYSGDKRKFVRVGQHEQPQQGPLTPETLRETLQWLHA